MHQRSDCEEQWVLLGAPLAAQAFMLLQVLAAACGALASIFFYGFYLNLTVTLRQ